MTSNEPLWDLMELEADERYYLNREGFQAKKPGIMITSGVFLAPDAKKREHYTVWFGQIAHWNFSSMKQAREKVQGILKTAKVPLQVVVKKRNES